MASKSQLKLSDIIRKEYLKPMAVSIGLMFFQQFSGINAVMFYSVIICLHSRKSSN
jgi:facilitated trehalose transporter